jgi:hypothetical protein
MGTIKLWECYSLKLGIAWAWPRVLDCRRRLVSGLSPSDVSLQVSNAGLEPSVIIISFLKRIRSLLWQAHPRTVLMGYHQVLKFLPGLLGQVA